MAYPQQRTLRQLLLSTRRLLGDVHEGVTTAIAPTNGTLRDGGTLRGKINDWASSEVYLYDDLVGRTVTAFDAIDKLTFAPAVAAPVASGAAYLLGNLEGTGFTHNAVLDAIQQAVLDGGGHTDAAPDTTLVTAADTWEFALPATLATLHTVELVATPNLGLRPWARVAKDRVAGWSVIPGTRRLRFGGATGVGVAGYTLRLHGRTRDAPPALMADVVKLDGGWVRDAAALHLALTRQDDPQYARLAAYLMPRVERHRPAGQGWYPDEVLLPVAG